MTGRPHPWERSYPPSVAWDAPLTASTLPVLFDEAIRRYGARTAIDYRDHAISYEALGAAVDATAAGFLRSGLGRDTSVAVYLPNTPYHPIALFAAAKAGARAVLLSPLDGERALVHKLKDSEARTLVTTNFASLMPMALKLLDDGIIDRLIVGDDAEFGPSTVPLTPIPNRHDVISLANFMTEGPLPASWPEVTPDQIALLQYTGGTTGLPKGAILTHANLTHAVDIYDAWLNPQGLSVPGNDKIICVLPLFHIYALTTILLRHIRNGNEILMLVRFDVDSVLRLIEVQARDPVPACRRCGSRSPQHRASSAATSRRCASAPPGAHRCRRGRRALRAPVGRRQCGGWGMTETSPAGTHLPATARTSRARSACRCPASRWAWSRSTDPCERLPPGEIGEIRIKGPNVTQGYWKRPGGDRAAFVDGWFLTGDIGAWTRTATFFLVDRKKDMIISSGFNVYPTADRGARSTSTRTSRRRW
jgi:long-chain acyl-CoA synthetase